jgi:hypothetical protein
MHAEKKASQEWNPMTIPIARQDGQEDDELRRNRVNEQTVQKVQEDADDVVAPSILPGNASIHAEEIEGNDAAVMGLANIGREFLNAWPLKLVKVVEMPLVVDGRGVDGSGCEEKDKNRKGE